MTKTWLVPVLMLSACGTSRWGEKPTQSEYSFRTYSIKTPAGDWGLLKIDEATEEIVFGSSRLGGYGQEVQSNVMSAWKVDVTESGTGNTEDELAEMYLSEERSNMAADKSYELKNVKKSVETVAGKKVFALRWRADFGALADNADGVLLVYFPPDWKSRRTFYRFMLIEKYRTGGVPGVSVDLKQIEQFVAGFATR
jgi:hypothetical protein